MEKGQASGLWKDDEEKSQKKYNKSVHLKHLKSSSSADFNIALAGKLCLLRKNIKKYLLILDSDLYI